MPMRRGSMRGNSIAPLIASMLARPLCMSSTADCSVRAAAVAGVTGDEPDRAVDQELVVGRGDEAERDAAVATLVGVADVEDHLRRQLEDAALADVVLLHDQDAQRLVALEVERLLRRRALGDRGEVQLHRRQRQRRCGAR